MSSAHLDVIARAASLLTSQASIDVLTERARQVEKEGWSHAHDDRHLPGELAGAGANYAINAADQLSILDGMSNDEPPDPDVWPCFEGSPWTWKPKDARRDLVRAAALLIAEIERMDRAAALTTNQPGEPS